MHVQLVRLSRNLFSNLLQQDLLVELLRLLRVEIGCEDTSGGVGCVGGPVLGHGEHEERWPHRERREDLEGFGEGTRFVARQ